MIEIIAKVLYDDAPMIEYGDDGWSRAVSWEDLEDKTYHYHQASLVLDAIHDNGYQLTKNPYHFYWGPNPSKD
jgi:hypothetical protein